jgi:hypothetical protein
MVNTKECRRKQAVVTNLSYYLARYLPAVAGKPHVKPLSQESQHSGRDESETLLLKPFFRYRTKRNVVGHNADLIMTCNFYFKYSFICYIRSSLTEYSKPLLVRINVEGRGNLD